MNRFLAVILFHNDEEIVEDQVRHMVSNKHDVIIFNHNSSDRTQELIDMCERNHEEVIKTYHIDASVSFASGAIFKLIRDIIIKCYKDDYDWITFVESDEFLEGPKRDKSYGEYLEEVAKTDATYIQFNNILFWFSDKDDHTVKHVRERIKHYAWFWNCGPRIYAWKSEFTNPEPMFNHNTPTVAIKHPIHFNTCHYPFTSKAHYLKKLETRKLATRGSCNYHYEKLYDESDKILNLKMEELLLYDDGSDLVVNKHYNWKESVY